MCCIKYTKSSYQNGTLYNGFRLEANDVTNIVRIVVPDIGMFIVSLSVLICCKKLIPRELPPLSDFQTSTLRRRVVQVGENVYRSVHNCA